MDELIQAYQPDRRSLIAHIGGLIGAAALPAEAFAASKANGKAAAKRFFTPSQMTLMTALADTIIPATDTPGAVATGVPGTLETMMANWASAETKTKVTAALAGVDKAAIAADGKPFAALPPERRKAVLIEHEKAALKDVPRKEKLSGLAALMGAPSVADPGYHRVKDLVVSLYYLTEIAMTEEVIFEPMPGKYVPSLKITPQTRPFAGGGLGG